MIIYHQSGIVGDYTNSINMPCSKSMKRLGLLKQDVKVHSIQILSSIASTGNTTSKKKETQKSWKRKKLKISDVWNTSGSSIGALRIKTALDPHRSICFWNINGSISIFVFLV